MNMLIDAEQTKNIEVEITEFTAKKIAKDVIMAALDLPFNCGIDDGKLVQKYSENFGYNGIKIVREATETDIAGVLILQEIEKW